MLCDRSPLLPMRWLLARKWPRMHRAPECYWQPMAPKLTSCLIWFIRWLTWTPENSPPREKEFYNWLPLCNARKSYWFFNGLGDLRGHRVWKVSFWRPNRTEVIIFEKTLVNAYFTLIDSFEFLQILGIYSIKESPRIWKNFEGSKKHHQRFQK